MAATTSFRTVSTLIYESLKHTDACPAFIILSSYSFQARRQLFSAAFYSTLKTPISPPPSFETTPIARFLLNDCGFSLHEANSICTREPHLLRHKSYENSRQTLLFLRGKGFHEIGVRKLLFLHPQILRASFQDIIKPKVELLEKIGLSGQKLSKVLERSPRILSASINRTLKPRVCFLQSLLDSELAALVSNPESDKITGKLVSSHRKTMFIVSHHPRILTWPSEKSLVGIAKDVEEMGIEKRSKAFARIFSRLCMLRSDTVKRKLENLRQLGFTEEEIRIIVKKFPSFLCLSENRLRNNFKFLVEEWKLPPNAILVYPIALGYSVEKRLKPRLQSLRALMTKSKSSKEAESYPPVRYMQMSEEDFHCQVMSRLPVATKENEEH